MGESANARRSSLGEGGALDSEEVRMHDLYRCRALVPGAFILSLILTGPARAGDPLDEVKARQQVDAQRIQNNCVPRMDYTLPADWVEKSKRGYKQVQLTQRERAILRELNTTRSVEFKGETFQEVINYLSKTTGQTITVPKNVLESAGVTYDTPIKLELKNVTTRSILKKMLAELNLTYIIKDEAIEITTLERATRTLTTRTYYVGDLVAAYQDDLFSAVYNQILMDQQLNSLAGMIINTYDPESWQTRGGAGTISFDPITRTLVVRQTAEFHYLMNVDVP
jgi:hypothetical protein